MRLCRGCGNGNIAQRVSNNEKDWTSESNVGAEEDDRWARKIHGTYILVETQRKCLNCVRIWKLICLTVNGKWSQMKMWKGCWGSASRDQFKKWQCCFIPQGKHLRDVKQESFFTELLKRFSQEKYEEGRKQEYLGRKQESDENTREYYTDKMRL